MRKLLNRFIGFTVGCTLGWGVVASAQIVITPSTLIQAGNIVGGVANRIPYFNSLGVMTNTGSMFWDNTNEQMNILGGGNFPTNNNGALLVTRKATGGSPILATGISVYRNSQFGSGTPTAGDIVNTEFLLQANDNLWYAAGGVGGRLDNITAAGGLISGGSIFYYKPAGGTGVDNTVPGMYLSSLAKLRVGDAAIPSAILEVKDIGTGFVLSAPTLAANATIATLSNNLGDFASTTSAQLASVISNETGSGSLVFGTAPAFTTSITSPIIYGGAGTTNSLTLRTTSGAGASGVIAFQTGTDGATEIARFTFAGSFLLGTQTASAKMTVVSNNQGAPFLGDFYSAATSGGAQFIVRKARGSVASPTQALNNDGIGSFSVRGFQSGGAFSNTDTGAINFFATEDFTASAQGTSLQLRTTPAGSIVPITAMQIGGAVNTLVLTTVVTPASTGQRFVCITTAGVIVSSPTACVGT